MQAKHEYENRKTRLGTDEKIQKELRANETQVSRRKGVGKDKDRKCKQKHDT